MTEPTHTTIFIPEPYELPTAHVCDHIQIRYLPETVLLDVCQMAPEQVDPGDVNDEKMVKRMPARVLTRVILTRAHALRLGQVLQKELAGNP